MVGARLVGEPAFRDAERVAGETRYYRVAAVDASARQGPASAEVSATTPAHGDARPAKVGSRDTGLIEKDAAFAQIVQARYPGRRVVQVGVDAVLAGGGGMHCITQQIPRASLV